MNTYQPDQMLLSRCVLTYPLFTIAITIFEKQHFEYITIGPALWLIFGFVLLYGKKVYTPNNRKNYFILTGNPALIIGLVCIILGVILAIGFNMPQFQSNSAFSNLSILQFFIVPILIIILSLFYGEKITQQ